MNASLEHTVLCVGALGCDVYLKNMPQNLMHTDTTFARDVTLRLGGAAANAAVNLSRMGLCARLASSVADDVFGAFCCDALEQEGVDTRFVRRDSQTGSAVSLLFFDQSGGRHCARFGGGSLSYRPESVTDDMLRGAQHLHIASFGSLPGFCGKQAVDLVSRARALGLRVSLSLDGVRAGDTDALRYLLPLCGVAVVKQEELFALTDARSEQDAEAFFSSFAPDLLIVTRGAHGVYATDCTQYAESFPLPCGNETIVDASGAGDAFISGFIAAQARGLSHEECLRTGTAAYALCLQSEGACAWSADMEAVRALLCGQGN